MPLSYVSQRYPVIFKEFKHTIQLMEDICG